MLDDQLVQLKRMATSTIEENGYGVGRSRSTYASSQSNSVLFEDDIELRNVWDTNSETVNVDDA